MTSSNLPEPKLTLRPLQLRDMDTIAALLPQLNQDSAPFAQTLEQFQRWYGLLKVLRLSPNPRHHHLYLYVAEQGEQLCGLIHVSPFNQTRSTWRVEQVWVDPASAFAVSAYPLKDTGSQLLRHCFETIWEARTWLVEVNINDKKSLGLYRHNGFQPLAELTYWSIAPEILQELRSQDPALPNLLPVSNTEANLLYQLDTVSMPPLVRQVFDRHVQDFKTSPLQSLRGKMQQWFASPEIHQAYVFEPQRKAAIGYFKLELATEPGKPHRARLTVHPAYTWLYPELLTQMAHVLHTHPPRPLELASTDYQPEREEYLGKLGADPIEHTLLMSRSVWHKLREAKPLEGLQLSDVLARMQPARTPVPTRISWLKSLHHHQESNNQDVKPEGPPLGEQ